MTEQRQHTLKEVSELTGVPVRALRRMVKDGCGVVEAVKTSKGWMFDLEQGNFGFKNMVDQILAIRKLTSEGMSYRQVGMEFNGM